MAEEVRVAEAVLAQRQSLERLSAIPHLHPRLKELQQQVGLACNVYPLAIKFSGIEFASISLCTKGSRILHRKCCSWA